MAWIIEPDDDAPGREERLPVGMPVMVVTLTPDGGIFEGLVTSTLASLHRGHFRVVVELRVENVLDRYPRRMRRGNTENRPEGEEAP